MAAIGLVAVSANRTLCENSIAHRESLTLFSSSRSVPKCSDVLQYIRCGTITTLTLWNVELDVNKRFKN